MWNVLIVGLFKLNTNINPTTLYFAITLYFSSLWVGKMKSGIILAVCLGFIQVLGIQSQPCIFNILVCADINRTRIASDMLDMPGRDVLCLLR